MAGSSLGRGQGVLGEAFEGMREDHSDMVPAEADPGVVVVWQVQVRDWGCCDSCLGLASCSEAAGNHSALDLAGSQGKS